MAPNPEAIAWYLQKSEGLLADLREELRSLRTRGGQLAGFSGAVLALAGANAEPILHSLDGLARDIAGASLLAGFMFLVVSLGVALRGTLLPRPVSDISPAEVANFTTNRFTREADLWRIHVRAIHTLSLSIESVIRQADLVERVLGKAEYFFLAGLFTVGAALATLVVVVTI
ncbi:MAG TPA: hypothetical protein VHS74_11285 [Solirubrobacterales bacterium]|nr:hypothetical protein [Solirubrobacterales bacterium]